jgi:hypothetical protein
MTPATREVSSKGETKKMRRHHHCRWVTREGNRRWRSLTKSFMRWKHRRTACVSLNTKNKSRVNRPVRIDVFITQCGWEFCGTYPCPQTTINAWSRVQERRRQQNRQGYQSFRYSDSDTVEQTTINNVADTYSNDAKCYGSLPDPIEMNTTWRIIGVNVNGLKPCGGMAALITVAERLLAPQAATIAFF